MSDVVHSLLRLPPSYPCSALKIMCGCVMVFLQQQVKSTLCSMKPLQTTNLEPASTSLRTLCSNLVFLATDPAASRLKSTADSGEALRKLLYMVSRPAFPAPPPPMVWSGRGEGWGGKGGVACAERGRGGWVGCCWGRPGVTERAGILHKPTYNVVRVPVFMSLYLC